MPDKRVDKCRGCDEPWMHVNEAGYCQWCEDILFSSEVWLTECLVLAPLDE